MTKTIKTSIQINATPEKIWSILTDFEKYFLWNPFIKSLKGDVKLGNTIDVKIQDMNFKPTILIYEKNKEFKWLGHLLFKGLFDGEHQFLIIDNGNGTSTFEQNEKFNGILVGLFSNKLDKETKLGFKKMNESLKQVVENL